MSEERSQGAGTWLVIAVAIGLVLVTLVLGSGFFFLRAKRAQAQRMHADALMHAQEAREWSALQELSQTKQRAVLEASSPSRRGLRVEVFDEGSLLVEPSGSWVFWTPVAAGAPDHLVIGIGCGMPRIANGTLRLDRPDGQIVSLDLGTEGLHAVTGQGVEVSLDLGTERLRVVTSEGVSTHAYTGSFADVPARLVGGLSVADLRRDLAAGEPLGR